MSASDAPQSVEVVKRNDAEIGAPITTGEMETLYRMGRALAASNFFKDAQKADEAFAKLVFGRDLGLSATQAMTDVHIIEGRPELSANLQAAKIKASGRYDYRILAHTTERCEVEFGPYPAPPKNKQGEWEPWPQSYGISEFTLQDAIAAGLVHKTRNGQKGMWEKYPRNMLFARAISNGVWWFCPDVMNGIRVYAEGEVREVVRHETAEVLTPDEPGYIAPEALAEIKARAGLLTDEQLQMELVGVGVQDVSDPWTAITHLTVPQATALIDRLPELSA